jgi:hypothetical protein
VDFRFARYARDELQACGEAFRRHFALQEYDNCDFWTMAVFKWFTEVKGCPGCVYPRVGRKGEFLVDYCHTTYPDTRKGEEWPSMTWWRRAIEGPCEILLALESEWGKAGRAELSHVMILDDACKLAAIRAQAKIMVFSSQQGRDLNEIYELLESLRARASDLTPWLCIDVPWEETRPRKIEFRLLG